MAGTAERSLKDVNGHSVVTQAENVLVLWKQAGCKESSKKSAVCIQIQMQTLVRLKKSDVWPSLGKKAVR